MKVVGGLGQGKVSEAAKKRTQARKGFYPGRKYGKRPLPSPLTIDSTTFTLDQWGDYITMTDATFVKYNRMDIPMTPIEKVKLTRKNMDEQVARAQIAETQLADSKRQLATLTKELEQVQRLANRAMLKLLDNGDL